MTDNADAIKEILDDVLDSPKREYCSGGWYEYNCPCCTEENGDVPDNKYNFAVSVEELYGHCWKCGYHGKISRIIKSYGTQEQFSEYKDVIQTIKERRFLDVNGAIDGIYDNLLDTVELELPKEFKMLNFDSLTFDMRNAVDYLIKGRGVDKDIIQKFKIGYIGNVYGKYKNRIVIPSYDVYGDLNYWIARDYTGEHKFKIYNPNVDKKKIVFNEYYINWYEPITLVEGPFDHIVVPNSIPLLGKSIDDESAVFQALKSKAKAKINIFLDDDATEDGYKMYKYLHQTFHDRVRIIECPIGYDASDYYKKYGKKGIIELLHSARKLDDFELAMI